MSILVTGSSRGIGLHLIKTFLQSPTAHVIATCRDPKDANELSQLQTQHPDKLTVEQLTVTDVQSIQELVNRLKEKKTTLSVLVNNAGIYSGMQKETLLNSTKESMLTVYETNCVAPMLLIQHLYNGKLMEKNALVVNISSFMGSIGKFCSNDELLTID